MISIGDGVIAMELGHVLRRTGCNVTILEAVPQLLTRMDPGAIAEIERESERIGMKTLKSVDMKSIAADGKTLTVSFVHAVVKKPLSAARVANDTARVTNIDGLDLEASRVIYCGLRIEVDEYLHSISNLDVYVARDAHSHTAQLSLVAKYEGRLVGDNIVNGDSKTPDYSYMPSAIYTVPAVATVGLTEVEADTAGKNYEAKTNDLSGWMSGRTYAETVAWSKILAENGTGDILDAHLAGHVRRKSPYRCLRHALRRAGERPLQHRLCLSDLHVGCKKLSLTIRVSRPLWRRPSRYRRTSSRG